jgi:ketosteroid isomerase-like protein
VRKVIARAALAAVVVSVAGCGGSGNTSASNQTKAREAALYEIDQLERTWHKAASTHDLDLMMSIWAPSATFTYGGKTYSGKATIRKLLAKAGPFQPANHWISDTPAYKIRTTVSGDTGTLYFECHYVDAKTRTVAAVVGADQVVQKIGGKWLITSSVAASPTLKP